MKTKKITKTVVLLIFLLPGSARLYAQGKPVAPTPPTRTIDAKGLSPRTAKLLLDLEEAQQQGLDKRTAALEHIQGRHGLMEKNGQLYVYAFIHTQGAVDLAHYGVLYNPSRARGNLIRGHIPVSNLKSLSEDPAVRQVELGSPMKIKLDAARTTTRVDQVHAGAGLPGSFMGDGVVVGIIDLGMDYTHPTFFDETGTGGYRIKRVWEQQATEGTPPSGYDYGAEYTAEAEILAAQNDFELATDSDGIFPHATHVAGIAAGSGGGLADYRGVAPQSEIVYVAVDMNSNLALIDGVEYIFDYAASVNKPCVINMSLGDHTGPHDGTSSLDKAFDQLAGAGRILVGSAGNEGKFRLHQNKTFSPGDDQLYSFVDFLPDYEGDSTTIDIWGTPGHAYEVVLHLYDPESDLIVASTAIVTSNSSSTQQFELQDPQSQDVVSVTMAMEENNLNNDKPHTYIELDHSTDEANFLPVLLDVRATSGSVDMWTADNCEFLARDKPFPYMDGNTNSTVGEIGGTGKSVISVGAYNSKTSWTSANGNTVTVSDEDYLLNGIAPFSSKGPTADGRTKPDITAPGSRVASAFSYLPYIAATGSTDVVESLKSAMVVAETEKDGQAYPFAVTEGTSMSSPMVAGIVALMLEADPTLTPSQARTLLKGGAITDTHTGTIPTTGSNTWGWGKVNAQASLQLLTGATSRAQAAPSSSFLVFPNPSQGTLQVVLADGGSSAYSGYRLVNALGQTVSSQSIGISTGQFEIRGLPAGMYSLILDSATQSVAQKVVVQP